MSTTPPSRLRSRSDMSVVVGVIWAQAQDRVIGAEGTMPWHVPEDMAYFRQVTRGSPVVMGRRTWESLPEAFRPLPGRVNVVITGDDARSRQITEQGALTASSLQEAVERAEPHAAETSTVWVMGGGTIYAEAIDTGLARVAAVTQLDLNVDGDTYAPALDPQQWHLVSAAPEEGWQPSESGVGYRFETYARR